MNILINFLRMLAQKILFYSVTYIYTGEEIKHRAQFLSQVTDQDLQAVVPTIATKESS